MSFLKTCWREGARFLGGSPVVLRCLRCHVCCDSALRFLKTFCWFECSPFLRFFQTPSGKVWQEKKLASGRKNTVLCVSVAFCDLYSFHALGYFNLVRVLQVFSFKRLAYCSEYIVRTWHIHLCYVI